MPLLVDRVIAGLRRDRDLPARALVRKLSDNAAAVASARLFLRGCERLGPRARCFGQRPEVRAKGRIRIGADFALSSTFGAVSLVAEPGAELQIGDGVTINYGTAIAARQSVEIGDRVKIGPYCVIADSDVPRGADTDDEPRPVSIDEDVWLGARVTVTPGSHIGRGAVVSAGSVVVGDIPDGAVASGNPARVLRVSTPPPPLSATRVRSAEPVDCAAPGGVTRAAGE